MLFRSICSSLPGSRFGLTVDISRPHPFRNIGTTRPANFSGYRYSEERRCTSRLAGEPLGTPTIWCVAQDSRIFVQAESLIPQCGSIVWNIALITCRAAGLRGTGLISSFRMQLDDHHLRIYDGFWVIVVLEEGVTPLCPKGVISVKKCQWAALLPAV